MTVSPDIADPGVVADLGLAVQLALGCVFACSVVPKLRRPARFVKVVDGYQVLPARATPLAAVTVLIAEAFVAVAFLSGWQVMAGGVSVIALALVFGVGTAVNLRRGRSIDCGCFGGTEQISPRSIQRLGVVAVGAAAITVGLGTEQLSDESLASAIDQGLVDGGAYLIATLGISAFLILAAKIALEIRSVIGVRPRQQGM